MDRVIDDNSLMLEWDHNKNTKLGLKPDELTLGSNKKAWWICHKCGYEWFTTINSRGRSKTSCPKCYKTNENSAHNKRWMMMYELARKYYLENGDLLISRNYIADNEKLGEWLAHQRSSYRRNEMSADRIKLLEEIGIVWAPLEETWEAWFLLAKEYYFEFGNLDISIRDKYQGKKLGGWLSNQRLILKGKQRGSLNQEQIDKLLSIGFVVDYLDKWWVEHYEEAKKFYDQYLHLYVPLRYETSSGYKLGVWIQKQRLIRKGTAPGELTEEQINLLNKIEMAWDDAYLKNQTSFSEQALYYYLKMKFNDTINRYKGLGVELDIFIPQLKLGIEYEGSYFHKNKANSDLKKMEICQDNDILLVYIKEKGSKPFSKEVIEFIQTNTGFEGVEESVKFIYNYINQNFKCDLLIDISFPIRYQLILKTRIG